MFIFVGLSAAASVKKAFALFMILSLHMRLKLVFRRHHRRHKINQGNVTIRQVETYRPKTSWQYFLSQVELSKEHVDDFGNLLWQSFLNLLLKQLLQISVDLLQISVDLLEELKRPIWTLLLFPGAGWVEHTDQVALIRTTPCSNIFSDQKVQIFI